MLSPSHLATHMGGVIVANDSFWPSSDPWWMIPMSRRSSCLTVSLRWRDQGSLWIWSLAAWGHLHKQASIPIPTFFISISNLWCALCDSLPPVSGGTAALGPVTMHLHHQWQKLWDVKYSGNLSSWMSCDTGLLLVTEAENICQNVINMGLVTITMRRR